MTPRPRVTRTPPPFEHIVELHGQTVLRFCIARAGAARGEDCFQETMLAALRGYASVRDPDAVLAWIFTIAARTAADMRRADAAAGAPHEDMDALAGEADATTGDPLLWARVGRLAPRQRQAVTLRYLGDMTHAAIGAALGIGEAAARRAVHDGLERLRRMP